MKAFFYRLTRELKGSLTGCERALAEGREGFRAFARRHSNWKYSVLEGIGK